MSLTPEHDARRTDGQTGLHPDVHAAYAYADRVKGTADGGGNPGIPSWHGWALREAFLAGVSAERTRAAGIAGECDDPDSCGETGCFIRRRILEGK